MTRSEMYLTEHDQTQENAGTHVWVCGSMRHGIEQGSGFMKVLQTGGLLHVVKHIHDIVLHDLVTQISQAARGTTTVAES